MTSSPRSGPVFVALLALASCDGASDPREEEIVAVMARADESIVRARPALAAGKYAKMAGGAYDFFRGTVPLYGHDVRAGTSSYPSRFGMTAPLVPCLGDPHPENFGLLRARDGSLGLEPNDFDAADRAPYLWDVRRLAAGLVLATMESNADDPAARAAATAARDTVARAGIEAYRDAMIRRARGEAIGRFTDFGSPILEDLRSRSDRDFARRRELADLTLVEGGQRRLRRGAVDPEDPQAVLADLPAFALEALPEAFRGYRATLVEPPPPAYFGIVDAAREYGSGVASFARVRALVLVAGPTEAPEDDVLLEVKELADSGLAGLYPPGVYADDVRKRIVATSRAAWAIPDAEPLWGTTRWLGLPTQVRVESEGQKGIRVERLVEERGTPDALVAMARAIGTIVARIHTSGDEGVENARAIYAKWELDPTGFVDEQVAFGLAYAERTVTDRAHFARALAERGPRLGIPYDPSDTPSADVRALLGTPPPPAPLPEKP